MAVTERAGTRVPTWKRVDVSGWHERADIDENGKAITRRASCEVEEEWETRIRQRVAEVRNQVSSRVDTQARDTQRLGERDYGPREGDTFIASDPIALLFHEEAQDFLIMEGHLAEHVNEYRTFARWMAARVVVRGLTAQREKCRIGTLQVRQTIEKWHPRSSGTEDNRDDEGLSDLPRSQYGARWYAYEKDGAPMMTDKAVWGPAPPYRGIIAATFPDIVRPIPDQRRCEEARRFLRHALTAETFLTTLFSIDRGFESLTRNTLLLYAHLVRVQRRSLNSSARERGKPAPYPDGLDIDLPQFSPPRQRLGPHIAPTELGLLRAIHRATGNYREAAIYFHRDPARVGAKIGALARQGAVNTEST